VSDQVRDGLGRGGLGLVEDFHGSAIGDHRVPGQVIEEPDGNDRRIRRAEKSLPVPLEQCEQPARRVGGFGSDGRDTSQEETRPALPIPAASHGVESTVVFLPVLFEVQTDIKERRLEQMPILEDQPDETAGPAPVRAPWRPALT
jgi:hypothetical protein